MRITSLANNINCFLSPLVDFLLTSVAICHKSANLDGTCELCRAFCLGANYCIAEAIVSDIDTVSSLLNENQSIMSLDCVQLSTINPNFSLRYIAHSTIEEAMNRTYYLISNVEHFLVLCERDRYE